MSILLSSSPRFTARLGLALIAAQIVWGGVGLRLLVPDAPGRSTGATFSPAIVAGPLVADIRCRWSARDDPEPVDADAAYQRSVDAFRCTNSWWTGGEFSEVPSSG